jgi:uncharacterized protein (TIGR02996 family)
MATREALLQAIIDAPDDDAPRFAFADAVRSSGDPDRAEFIRVHCALDKIPAQAPERPTLEASERELLEQHGWDWAEEFGTQISEWVFRRGFIERVEMCLETSTEEILAVLRKAPIRHVRDTSQFCDFSGFVGTLPHMERLTGLEFWYLYAFEDSLVAQMLASPHLRNLHTLILHHDRNGNMVEERVLIEAMASPYRSNLQELGVNIDGCWRGPSRGILKAMAGSPYLRNLRKLNLSEAGDVGNSAQMDVETSRCMSDSPNFVGLEELDLGRTSFPIEVWEEVLKWRWLSRLKWLRLHYARQVKAPDFFYTVAELKDLPPYRKAFEKRVSRVDWDTEFISPWDGTTCWHGLTWKDRPRRLLYGMERFLRTQDYAGLEAEYRRLCEKLAGEQVARAIDELLFNRYEKSLQLGFRKAVSSFAPKHGRCIFLRLRPDIEWEGKFHVQARDPGLDEPREEFSYEGPVTEYPAGRFPEAARFYAEHPLYSGTKPSGPALYVLAKTVAAFGRCLSAYSDLPPVYFSCMYAVFRMKGQSSGEPDGGPQGPGGSCVILNPSS